LLALWLGPAAAAQAAADAPLFRFAIVTDVQHADKPTVGLRRYAATPALLQGCVEDLNRQDLAFVMQLGDLVDGNGVKTRADLDRVLAIFHTLKAPLHHVIGNHCLTVTRPALMEAIGLAKPYYAFDLLYLDGYDLRRVDLEQRKNLLSQILAPSDLVHFSEHFPDGTMLYNVAKERGLEGIVAKRRRGCYVEKRSREWLKIKITQRLECVIGGYTDPKGSRENFGSIVLGLYDDKGRLIHVGQAGSGFTESTHKDMWRRLQQLHIDKSPFYGKVEANRKTHWVKPELVAEIKFTEWTHEGQSGAVKMRAPVFEGLREDKAPRECVFEKPKPFRKEMQKAEHGEAA
jgi:hypothetical protein